ncbi:phosphoribosylglycinamide formyltransferase [Bacillus shivajii]|uniref:phosphoribosylglycinamide formyltransferase n=1 Tax=Bacillus shivajii TaxID=1983719 RepID=UPI001CFC2572|nr:phosphoribosylglycinamide formyltransferase [Bacillus shivajii]UCZ53793.1 phosphoribosylglycinamide formyltransferase [Bacillus shivajii]
MINIAVFASGSGSNFEAVVRAERNGNIDGNVKLLVTDNANAFVIERAAPYNIPVYSFNPKLFDSKEAFERKILNKLEEYGIELIVLAGYMRLIGPTLLSHYEGRILNIHPSLLPAFPGLDAVGQAHDAKVKVTGVTVHFVDHGMDTGPIITQEAVKIDERDSKEEVQRRIQRIEHSLYPATIQFVIEKLKRSGG